MKKVGVIILAAWLFACACVGGLIWLATKPNAVHAKDGVVEVTFTNDNVLKFKGVIKEYDDKLVIAMSGFNAQDKDGVMKWNPPMTYELYKHELKGIVYVPR